MVAIHKEISEKRTMAAGGGGGASGFRKLATLLLIPLVIMALSSLLSVDAEVTHCKTAECKADFIKAHDRVVIAVYKSTCDYLCKMSQYDYEQLSEETRTIKYAKINKDEVSDKDLEGVTTIPTYIFYEKGVIVQKVEGHDLLKLFNAVTGWDLQPIHTMRGIIYAVRGVRLSV